MSIRLSEIYGMDIYEDSAGYIGKVYDVILNAESGEVVRLTTKPIRSLISENAKKMIQENSIMFKRVKSIKDIVLVQK